MYAKNGATDGIVRYSNVEEHLDRRDWKSFGNSRDLGIAEGLANDLCGEVVSERVSCNDNETDRGSEET